MRPSIPWASATCGRPASCRRRPSRPCPGPGPSSIAVVPTMAARDGTRTTDRRLEDGHLRRVPAGHGLGWWRCIAAQRDERDPCLGRLEIRGRLRLCLDGDGVVRDLVRGALEHQLRHGAIAGARLEVQQRVRGGDRLVVGRRSAASVVRAGCCRTGGRGLPLDMATRSLTHARHRAGAGHALSMSFGAIRVLRSAR